MRAYEINIVLVRTIYDSNIGAAARSMTNMGADRLILIDPKCEITLKAHQSAASGQVPLENRITYSSWDEFHQKEGQGVRIAFTARDGKGRQVREFKDVLHYLKKEDPQFQKTSSSMIPIYLIFGPEDWGLSAEDLALVHFACCIPTWGDNSSLNLAQAVLLSLFIFRDQWGGNRTILEGQTSPRRASTQNIFPDSALQTWLREMGFEIDNRPISAYSVLKRMLLQNVPNTKELKILDIILNQSIRKLREYNGLREQMGLPAIKVKNNNSNN